MTTRSCSPTPPPPAEGDGDAEAGGALPDTGSPAWWGSVAAALAAILMGIVLTRQRRTSPVI